jgi:hypothetical protein
MTKHSRSKASLTSLGLRVFAIATKLAIRWKAKLKSVALACL